MFSGKAQCFLSRFWVSKWHLVDAIGIISTYQQSIAFVQYVVKDEIKVRFFDIRKVDGSGATESNFFAMFKSVPADYQLDLKKHVAIAIDGAATVIGRQILCRRSWKREWNCGNQGCGAGAGVGVVRSRRFLGGIGVGFLTTLAVGVGFFCPTPDVQLDDLLNHILKLGIPVEMVQFLLKLLLKQRFLAVHHDFHWL